MPRRRTRRTNRKPQEERRLRIRGVRRDMPDAKKLSRAFIGLALARAEADAQAQAKATPRAADQEQHGGNADGETENGAA